MMETYHLDRSNQILYFRGKSYTPEDILSNRFHQEEVSEDSDVLKALDIFLKEWFSASELILVQTSGSTGSPKEMAVEKEKMVHSALATCRFFHLHKGQKAYLCMNLKYIGAKMMVVRSLVAGMNLVLCPTIDGRPLRHLEEDIDFAAMVPLQLYNTLEEDVEKMNHVRTLIVGGGAVEENLQRRIQSLPTSIYSTYGMTETLSHIALRKLNGPDRQEGYTPLENIYLSTDKEGRLLIQAPSLTDQVLKTHDLVRLDSDGTFHIEGRTDNVIITGGIKIQIEKVEKKLEDLLDFPFAITSIPDEKFGEKIILLLERTDLSDEETVSLAKRIGGCLDSYEKPKGLLRIAQIPMTENGKIKRIACRELAERFKNLIFVSFR